MSYLYKGRELSSDVEVLFNPKQVFDPDKYKGCQKRPFNQVIDQIVLHWTAGEGGNTGCYNVLKNRKDKTGKPSPLSVHFGLDYDGQLQQFADIYTQCYHAGRTANAHSVGIEIQNAGVPPGSKKYPRGTYSTVLKGRKRSFLLFNTNQLDTLVEWIDDMCDLLAIPKKLPRVNGVVPTTTMTPKQLRDHKGVLFHYMIANNKIDPGTQLIDVLIDEGY